MKKSPGYGTYNKIQRAVGNALKVTCKSFLIALLLQEMLCALNNRAGEDVCSEFKTAKVSQSWRVNSSEVWPC